MAKISWKAGTMVYPVPPALISCGTVEKPNVMTAAWTGIINSEPPMTYVSIRPSRLSHEIISKTKNFVINLPTLNMVSAVDFCGVKSGRDTDKFKETGLTPIASSHIEAPQIEECPISVECRVLEIKPYGSHDMFLAEIEAVDVDDKYIDAYVNISYIYSKTKDYKLSMLYANKALLLDKDYAYAHYRKAWALQETGKFEEAIDGYSKAIELDPSDIYNYLGIACVSLNTQANLNALLYANKAILIDRNCGGAYYYKSLALSNLGKSKEAEQAFSIAQRLGYSPS